MRSRINGPRCSRTRVAAACLVLLTGVLLGGCGTTDPTPTAPDPAQQAPTVSPSPSASTAAFHLEIVIYAWDVAPSDRTFQLDRDQTVVLVTNSDHDVTMTVRGNGIEKDVFVARNTTVVTSFVASQSGKITISSTEPQAIIATLVVDRPRPTKG